MDITFQRADGKQAKGFMAMPKEGENTASVVLIHEWWGITDQIRGTATRLAEEGFRVLVPDLFEGKTASLEKEDEAAATKLMNELDWQGAVHGTIRGAVKHLKERTPGSRCAVMGFCMGGALALASAVHVREADAAVVFYGIPDKQLADPRMVRIPTQLHFAKRDDWCTPERVHELERELKAGGVNYELHHYDSPHAFLNEKRPKHHDPVNAKAAWDRAMRFLESTIGGHATVGPTPPGQAPIP